MRNVKRGTGGGTPIFPVGMDIEEFNSLTDDERVAEFEARRAAERAMLDE